MKLALFGLLALPLIFLGVDIAAELTEPGSRLGADPGQAVVIYLGEWSLWMLLAVLTVSTGRRVLSQPKLIRYRRMVGLFAFAYLCLHLLAYVGFLAGFAWQQVLEDVTDRPYISVGFLALLFFTATTGLALLFLRHTGAMGLTLAIHLGFVLALFATLPYGKFVHSIYRLMALVRSRDEANRAEH